MPPAPATPISFWNVDSGPRIPNTPPSPTTLSALQSDVSCWASGSDYPPGEGAVVGPACSVSSGSGRLVLVFQRGPAAPGSHFLWRLSHSPLDPQTPQAVGIALARDRGRFPHPQLEFSGVTSLMNYNIWKTPKELFGQPNVFTRILVSVSKSGGP